MKLNESELNYILTECFEKVLNEDNSINQKQVDKNLPFNYNFSTNVRQDDDGVTPSDPKIKRNNVQNAWKRGKFGKGAATALGGMAVGAILGGLIGGNLGNIISNLGMIGGIAGALQMIGASHMRYNQMKNFKIPRNPEQAKKIAELSVIERYELSQQCKNLQGNFNNALQAYNSFFGQFGQTQLTWDMIKDAISNTKFSITEKYLGGGSAEVNINTNFNNQNVTESKINEAYLQNNEYNKRILPIKDYQELFEDEGQEYAVEIVYGIAKLYTETYQLWYKWTRYIKVLIDYFPDHIKWNDLIQNIGKVSSNNMWNYLYKAVFPNLSQVTDAIQNRNKTSNGKSRKDIEKDIQNKYSDTTSSIIIVNNSYKTNYIIFRDENTNEFYAMNKQRIDSNTPISYGINQRFSVDNIKKYLTGNGIKDSNGTQIPVVNNKITNTFQPITV